PPAATRPAAAAHSDCTNRAEGYGRVTRPSSSGTVPAIRPSAFPPTAVTMPDTLKLNAVLEAADPALMGPHLAPFFAPESGPLAVDLTRLQPPICYWAVY